MNNNFFDKYTVKQGDNLYQIAMKNIQIEKLSNAYTIRPLAAALAAETDITHPAPSLHIIPQRGAFYGAFPKRH